LHIRYLYSINHSRANIAFAFIVAITLHMIAFILVPIPEYHGAQEKTKKTINVEFRVNNTAIITSKQVHQESTLKLNINSKIISVSQPVRHSYPTKLNNTNQKYIVTTEERVASIQMHQENKNLDLSVPTFSSINNIGSSNNFKKSSALISKNEPNIYKTDISLPPETALGRSIAAAAIPDCLKQQRSGGLLAIPELISDAAMGRCK